MRKGNNMENKLSEEEIDKIVAEQADNPSAWEAPIRVRRARATSLSVPADLAARAAFLARAHRDPGVQEWLVRIIQERVELEEVAFAEAKRDMATKGSG